jgi:hypothetical protein
LVVSKPTAKSASLSRRDIPCYFVGFSPEPMPGQTIEDIARAEAIFLEKVIDLHPDAEGEPCVIRQLPGGMGDHDPWQRSGRVVRSVDRMRDAPLSYWAGVRGKNPMRYSGGCLAAAGDGAHRRLGRSGSSMVLGWYRISKTRIPSNTLWSKTVQPVFEDRHRSSRYLEFERWWGGHVNLNAEEIQFIVDELFVGNKLATGRFKMSDGSAIDLRNIRSPIVVFCSKGDNVTLRNRALGWILDLYESVDAIRSHARRSSIACMKPPATSASLSLVEWRARNTRRIFQQHRSNRRAAARSLRGGLPANDAEAANSDLASGRLDHAL